MASLTPTRLTPLPPRSGGGWTYNPLTGRMTPVGAPSVLPRQGVTAEPVVSPVAPGIGPPIGPPGGTAPTLPPINPPGGTTPKLPPSTPTLQVPPLAPPSQVTIPTFQPQQPTTDPRMQALIASLTNKPQPQQPTTDPRMAALITSLTKELGEAQNLTRSFQRDLTAQPSADLSAHAVTRPELVSTAQQQALEARLLELLSGQGPDIGDISSDPEARAFRLARTRESELQRQEEAEALAASGLSGSGDFESRRFQIGEGRAEDIAGFEAELAGRRRRELTDTALRGAGLSLQDLTRQAALEESRGMTGERAEDRRLMAAMEQARLRQSGAASAGQLALGGLSTRVQGTQGLLGLLGAESARKDQLGLAQEQLRSGEKLSVLGLLGAEGARKDQFGLAQQQLASEIAFRTAQLNQAQQDLLLRRDQFRSDAEFRQAQFALQQQMFDLQKLREELERQLILEQLRRERKSFRDQYGAGVGYKGELTGGLPPPNVNF